MLRPPSDLLLRPGQAATQLGVHRETVKRWMRKGVVSYEEVGPFRVKRLRQSVIDALRRSVYDRAVSRNPGDN